MNDQIPLAWDRAIDYNVYDHAGNKFIDFTSSIFVANVGHANPKVVEAIQNTINKGLSFRNTSVSTVSSNCLTRNKSM